MCYTNKNPGGLAFTLVKPFFGYLWFESWVVVFLIVLDLALRIICLSHLFCLHHRTLIKTEALQKLLHTRRDSSVIILYFYFLKWFLCYTSDLVLSWLCFCWIAMHVKGILWSIKSLRHSAVSFLAESGWFAPISSVWYCQSWMHSLFTNDYEFLS